MARVTGHVKRVKRRRGPVFYLKYRLADGRQVERLLGPEWPANRGRPPEGYFTPRTAQEALDAILTDARRGTLADHDRPTGRTWGDACAEWLRYCEKDKGVADSTLRDYRNIVNGRLLTEFGKHTALEKVTTASIDAYRERLLDEGKLSRRTVQKLMVAVYGILARAVKRGWVSSNAAALVERVRLTSSGSFNVLEPTQVAALVRAAENDQDAALYEFAAFSGLRLGELRALRWADVRFADATIAVEWNLPAGGAEEPKRPKSAKVRTVPLIDQAAAALDRLSRRGHNTGPRDLVFVEDHEGLPADGDALRDRFYAAIDKAGFAWMREREDDPIVLHDLRHTFGSLGARVWPLHDLKAYMGHAKIETTERYLHHVPRTTAAGELSRAVEAAMSPESVSRTVSRNDRIPA
jgi:integrase